MYNIMMFSFILIIILSLLMFMLYMLSMKTFLDREKCSPFECGFDPFESPRIPFSSHFFLLAVIFLIFDVELVIIMPSIMMMQSMSITNIMYCLIIIVILLLIGLYHEWNNNMLNWI
uniref:NADH-ubiquinone oxidoreductase chain 3 n=1 Tax=Mogannia minuta TaxID=2170271 RepID=A0A344ALT6_9HEMI|nr:NADH dehydrogenase subunit 3 [Mogannia minuta]